MANESRRNRVLALFQHLTTLTKTIGPERDPRLEKVGILPKAAFFSGFDPKHMNEVKELYEILHAARDFEDFIHLAKQARHIVNHGLFAFALSTTLLHRHDSLQLAIPPIKETLPDRFIPAETINKAIREDHYRTNDDPIIVDVFETGNNWDPEYRLAYFREDIDANSHHWYWHLVYPTTWVSSNGRIKDRKGELFYYMHQQMLARYDLDRLCAGLARVVPYHDFNSKLDGYAPHLYIIATGDQFTPRPNGLVLQDVRYKAAVQDLERWRERILQAIDLGYIIDEHDNKISLKNESGIDLLGAIVEASVDSKNYRYYGDLHNHGHNLIAKINDPDNRFKKYPGVMSVTETALRDPAFYRWHRFIDNVFNAHKETLPKYEKKELVFPGIIVNKVSMNGKFRNVVNTFMKEEQLELSHGISLKGSVKVRYHHLDHEPFTYTIDCENNSGSAKEAMVRIFLGPVHDENGEEFTLAEARRYFIELDKFRAGLDPGKNTITWESSKSSVTLRPKPNFDDILSSESEDDNSETYNYCHCGWPDHLLVPKGNHKGVDFRLFVMLTDYEQDKVVQNLTTTTTTPCEEAVSYCGSKGQKYPDKKAMGFPFDRLIEENTFLKFSTPNMIFQKVRILSKE